MIYLDNAATTYPKSEAVYLAMDQANRSLAFNAGRGSYLAARNASSLITSTREKMISLFHADGLADTVFTPSVTHAINQVLHGIDFNQQTVVYVTPYEHNAVARTIESIRQVTDCQLHFLPLRDDLTIDLDQMEFDFSSVPPDIVVMNVVSNVTGYELPVKSICAAAKEYDAITIIDAAQAAGLVSFDLRTLEADIICFAGHKTLEGPFGVGGFVIKKAVAEKIKPVFTGGTGSNSLNTKMPETSPEKFEASSPNIVAIAGLNAALQNLCVPDHYSTIHDLTVYLKDALGSVSKVRPLGLTDSTIGIVSFIVEGYSSPDVGSILGDEFEIAVRTGYHCAPFIHAFLNDGEYSGTVRVGLGRYNTKSEIDALVEALKTL